MNKLRVLWQVRDGRITILTMGAIFLMVAFFCVVAYHVITTNDREINPYPEGFEGRKQLNEKLDTIIELLEEDRE